MQTILQALITVLVFVLFVPGVFVRLSKNKMAALVLHAVLFAIAFSVVNSYLHNYTEGLKNCSVNETQKNPSMKPKIIKWTCPDNQGCGSKNECRSADTAGNANAKKALSAALSVVNTGAVAHYLN